MWKGKITSLAIFQLMFIVKCLKGILLHWKEQGHIIEFYLEMSIDIDRLYKVTIGHPENMYHRVHVSPAVMSVCT